MSASVGALRKRGIVTSWHEAGERMFGYSADEMIGQSIRRLIPADQQQEEDMMLARLARNDCIVHFETVGLGKDGRTFAASVTVSLMRHDDNRRGRPLRRTAKPSRANLPRLYENPLFSANGNSRCDGERSSLSLAASQRRGRHQRRRSNPSGGGLASCGRIPKLTPIANPDCVAPPSPAGLGLD
jgi:PAS domain S-box-containing protein